MQRSVYRGFNARTYCRLLNVIVQRGLKVFVTFRPNGHLAGEARKQNKKKEKRERGGEMLIDNIYLWLKLGHTMELNKTSRICVLMGALTYSFE